MAFTAIPSGDVWVQIGSTQTPTSGTTVSFTSIPAVKKLRLVIQNITLTANGNLDMTFNNDATALYNWSYFWSATTPTPVAITADTKIRTGRGAGGSGHVADYIIDYSNQSMPKMLTGWGGNNLNALIQGVGNYNSTAIVNRLDVTTASTFAAGNTGTIAIYGAY